MIKSDAALDAVSKNCGDLLSSAKKLHDQGNYSLSTHVSILSIEESSKYLILFCKSYLPESVFRKRFQHLNKHIISGAPWFLSGQLTLIYAIHLAMQKIEGNDETSRSARDVSKYLTDLFYRNDPEAIAKSIMGVLEPDTPGYKEINLKGADQREKHRLSSVYVDVSDDLLVVSSPDDIGKETSEEYIDEATFCAAVIGFIGTPTKSITDFVQVLPPAQRQKLVRDSIEKAEMLVDLIVAHRAEQAAT